MNEIAKKCIQNKLIAAIEKEHLKTSEAANMLRISPAYVSMIKNERHWGKCPSKVWEVVQRWTNSGVSLKEYETHKHKFVEYVDKILGDQSIKECDMGDENLNKIIEALDRYTCEDLTKDPLNWRHEGYTLYPENEYKQKCDEINSEVNALYKSAPFSDAVDNVKLTVKKQDDINKEMEELRKQFDHFHAIELKKHVKNLSIEIDITLSINGKKINLNT